METQDVLTRSITRRTAIKAAVATGAAAYAAPALETLTATAVHAAGSSITTSSYLLITTCGSTATFPEGVNTVSLTMVLTGCVGTNATNAKNVITITGGTGVLASLSGTAVSSAPVTGSPQVDVIVSGDLYSIALYNVAPSCGAAVGTQYISITDLTTSAVVLAKTAILTGQFAVSQCV